MPRAVLELPKAEVRTSAGRKSVRPCSRKTAPLRVPVTALCPRVASPTAQQVAWAALVSGKQRKARVGKTQRSPCGGGPSRRTPRAPSLHPRVIDLSVPKFLQSRAGTPKSLPSRASEAGLNARSCLDLQALLVVPITIVRSDALSVSEGGFGQILHGVFGPGEDVAPGELALCQGFVKLLQ